MTVSPMTGVVNQMGVVYDADTVQRALGSAAVTSTATVGAYTTAAANRNHLVARIIVEAIKISANDEIYTFVVQGSNDDFTTSETLGMVDLGATEVRLGGSRDTAAGEVHDILFSTAQGNTAYKDVRVRLVIDGTSPSITFGCFITRAA